jgi:hypothetical protein
MGYNHLKPTLLLLATVLWANVATAQATEPYLKEVLVLNGGQYGNPQEDITLIGYNPFTGATRISDTIRSQSIQALLIEGNFAYIAAEDSLVKISLTDFTRVAQARFPGASTYSLALYNNQLLVGNWYGQADSNLYVFDKSDLTLDYVVPQIEQGVKGIAIIGDTAYLAQNLNDANYSDSAGYLSLVYLPTSTFIKNVPGDGVSDIGKLQNYAGGFIGIGSATDMASFYDPTDGSLNINPIGLDVTGGYGNLMQLVNDTLFGVFDDKIGSINVTNGNLINASLVDTLITSFVYDTLSQNFYVTQTDYFSYTRGIVFNKTGVPIDTFLTGYAPEAMGLVYGVNTAPVAVDDAIHNYNSHFLTYDVLSNDYDQDGDSLVITIIVQPTYGNAVIVNNIIEFTDTFSQDWIIFRDTITYQICDYNGASLCSVAKLSIYTEWEGVQDLKNLNLAIYPNPVSDNLAISNTGNEAQTLVLTDLAGRTLKTMIAQRNTTTTIDLSNLARGLYLLLGADGNFAQKVVKQ